MNFIVRITAFIATLSILLETILYLNKQYKIVSVASVEAKIRNLFSCKMSSYLLFEILVL